MAHTVLGRGRGRRVRIKRVDMDGYCGRDRHPKKSDEGLYGTIIAMVEHSWYDPKGDELDDFVHGDEILLVPGDILPDHHSLCYLVLMEDGRELELIDFEIRAIPMRKKRPTEEETKQALQEMTDLGQGMEK
jgi:hypothetical protein